MDISWCTRPSPYPVLVPEVLVPTVLDRYLYTAV
eukprot:SAG31_NODE_36839_length_309_cov_3.552381_1_plen_33_part_01